MNLTATCEIYGGGPGSGCNPERGRCGRIGMQHLPKLTFKVGKRYLNDNNFYIKAYKSGMLVGTIGAREKWPGVWKINSYPVVDENLRGRGYGQRLYHEAMKVAWEHGGTKFVSDNHDQQAAGAQQVWSALRHRYPDPYAIQDIGGHYEADLNKMFGGPYQHNPPKPFSKSGMEDYATAQNKILHPSAGWRMTDRGVRYIRPGDDPDPDIWTMKEKANAAIRTV